MSAFQKFQNFVLDLGKGVHHLHAAGDTLKVYLSNAAPNLATMAVKADMAEIAAANNYPAGGTDVQNDYTQAGGVGSLTGVDVVFTATGGAVGPFRYAVLYNDTSVAPAKPLIGVWDYGSAITLADGETVTVDFGATLATLT